MKNIIQEIKNKLNNFDNDESNDLFFLISNFKYLEKMLKDYGNQNISKTFKEINKILENAFVNKNLNNSSVFELLQELLYIEKVILELNKTSSSTDGNSNDTLKKVAIGLGIGALGFAVGKAFIDANRSSKNLENEDILTVAYYLSKYNHDYLFDGQISAAKAIENIAKVLGIKPNTLRGKRDYFDTFLGENKNSTRKGFQNAKLTKHYEDIINKYYNSNEEVVKIKVIKILNNYSAK